MNVAEALELRRGDRIEEIHHHPQAARSSYNYRVTTVIMDGNGMTKVCTDKGRVLFPEQIRRVTEDEQAQATCDAASELRTIGKR